MSTLVGRGGVSSDRPFFVEKPCLPPRRGAVCKVKASPALGRCEGLVPKPAALRAHRSEELEIAGIG